VEGVPTVTVCPEEPLVVVVVVVPLVDVVVVVPLVDVVVGQLTDLAWITTPLPKLQLFEVLVVGTGVKTGVGTVAGTGLGTGFGTGLGSGLGFVVATTRRGTSCVCTI
jgi:hypothetical protein